MRLSTLWCTESAKRRLETYQYQIWAATHAQPCRVHLDSLSNSDTTPVL